MSAPTWGEWVSPARVPLWQDWAAVDPPGGDGENPPGPDGVWVRVPRAVADWLRLERAG